MIHNTAHTGDACPPDVSNPQRREQREQRKRGLTVEVALWLLVLALALGVRLVQLDRAPLSTSEAHEAMLAWRAASDRGLPPTADYSPLLFALNTVTFTLRGAATDSLARWWPALAGALLALSPVLFRERVGRVGALFAGLYLAISPACLVASRQVDGAVFAALGGMVCLGGLARALGTDDRRWLFLSTLGLALALTGSSLAYGILLPLGVGGGLLLVGGRGEEKSEKKRSVYLAWFQLHWPLFVGVASLLALAFSTMLGGNVGGLGAAGGLLVAWLSGFRALVSAPPPLMLLFVYEPMAVLFGLGGIGVVLWRQHRFGILVGLWAVFSSLLLALAPGRSPLTVLSLVLPLSLLVGVAFEQVAQAFRRESLWLNEGIHVPVVLLLWIHCGLMLARYTVLGSPSDLALAFLTVALQVLLAAMFAITMDIGAVVRAVVLGTGLVALGVTFAAGWGVAHVRPTDPREPLAWAPTDLGVRKLVETLRERSWRETGFPTTLPLVAQADFDSPLAWYLRDFSHVHFIYPDRSKVQMDIGPGYSTDGQVQSLDVQSFDVIVTAEKDLGMLAETLDASQDTLQAVGQDFVLHRGWEPEAVACVWTWPPDCQGLVKWWLFRETDTPLPVEESVVLWVLDEPIGLR